MFGTRTTTLTGAAAIAVVLAGAGVAIGRSSSSDHHNPPPVTAPTSAVTPTAPTTAPTTAPLTPTSPPTPPAKSHVISGGLSALLARTYRLALAQHTVHSVARNVSAKFGTTIFDDYDGARIGKQHIVVDGGYIDIRVVGTTTYLNGDAKGLATYGFTAQEVEALHGQWLPLVAGQAGYEAVTTGVTLASTLHGDRLVGQLRREATKTLDDQQVFGISGHAVGGGAPRHATGTMWISTTTGLPVEFDTANAKTQITETFTDWGAPISVPVPPNVAGQPGVSA